MKIIQTFFDTEAIINNTLDAIESHADYSRSVANVLANIRDGVQEIVYSVVEEVGEIIAQADVFERIVIIKSKREETKRIFESFKWPLISLSRKEDASKGVIN